MSSLSLHDALPISFDTSPKAPAKSAGCKDWSLFLCFYCWSTCLIFPCGCIGTGFRCITSSPCRDGAPGSGIGPRESWSMVIGIVFVLILFAVMRFSPRRWWLLFWFPAVLILLVLVVIMPLLI